MRTRAEYEEMVKGPGKFEGEPPWTAYFWELMLDGAGETVPIDGSDDYEDIFEIQAEDVEMFPELEGVKRVVVWQDENGFVYSRKED